MSTPTTTTPENTVTALTHDPVYFRSECGWCGHQDALCRHCQADLCCNPDTACTGQRSAREDAGVTGEQSSEHQDQPVWSGQWVSERLDLALNTGASATDLELSELVGLAVRRNPRRAHLLVSTVLGKHVPTDPRVVDGAGRLLGALVAQALEGLTPHDHDGGHLLGAAMTGNEDALAALERHLAYARSRRREHDAVVLGYAETATGLGHCVAAMLDAPVLHSTRRPVAGVTGAAGFEEEHSHATSHLLLPADPHFLTGHGPLVLVDDEMSTGTTAANTIRALHTSHPRSHYVIAALIDLRSAQDRARMDELAAELGARVDVVALTAGTVAMPEGVLAAGQELAASIDPLSPTLPEGAGGVVRHTPWPLGAPEGGRHGLDGAGQRALHAAAADTAAALRPALAGATRVHVIGTEELMYAPLQVALVLQRMLEGHVTYSTSTRSPVLVVDDPGYAIASGITFAAHDDPDDGPGPRYAYNVPTCDAIVVVTDTPGDTATLTAPGGLVHQLSGIAPTVHLVTIPVHTPTTSKDLP